MTLVVAHRFWKAVAVIADCRVTYLPPDDHQDDCLQKIYQVGDRLVLGFSGPLRGAHKVLDLVRENTARYSRPPVAHNLGRDVERWIRHRYGQLDESERKDLSFIAATVEPQRERPSTWQRLEPNGKRTPITKPTWFPYVPEWHTFALVPSTSNTSNLARIRKPHPLIIGVKRKKHREIVRQVIAELYGFTHRQPELQLQVVMQTLVLKLLERQVTTVGGLFQCALLSERGIHWVGQSGGKVVLQHEHGRFVQRNTATGDTLPLLSIWEWYEKPRVPGSFGTFGDPDLWEAVKGLRQTADNKTDPPTA